MALPEGSSAALLMRKPDESCETTSGVASSTVEVQLNRVRKNVRSNAKCRHDRDLHAAQS